ncbi:MAG: putative integral rane protein [Frankiales bacterium]|nr:putative integral rane protein [Frankiales bacterium]
MTAESTAEQVHDSTAVEGLARLGLASRGMVWLVVGLLAGSVALGRSDERTDRTGALSAIADKPLGEVLLVVLVVGFLGYGLWRLLEAAVGHRDDDGAKRWAHRALSLGKGVVYVGLAVSTVQFLQRGGGGQDKTGLRTADLMGHTGGRTTVGVVGAALVVAGLVVAVRALKEKHSEKLEHYRLPDRFRRPAVVIGVVGLVGRGGVLALLGAFLVRAAVQFDPEEAKGLDAALQVLSQQSFGRVLLLAAVVGMLGYALWSFVEAAYRDL